MKRIEASEHGAICRAPKFVCPDSGADFELVTDETRERDGHGQAHLRGLALRGWRGLVKHRIEFNHRVLYLPKDTPYQLAARWDAVY
jgi:hypothetical protein